MGGGVAERGGREAVAQHVGGTNAAQQVGAAEGSGDRVVASGEHGTGGRVERCEGGLDG